MIRALAIALTVAAVAIALLAWRGAQLRAELRAGQQHRHVAEGNALVDKGFELEREMEFGELAARAARVPGLEAQLARALKAAPGGRVERLVEASTIIIADGKPRDEGEQGDYPCLLRKGDPTEVKTGEVTVAYKEQSRVALGASQLYRVRPGEHELIGAGAWSAGVTEISRAPPPAITPVAAAPGWGLGGGVFVGRLAPALAVVSPPGKLFDREVGAAAAAGFGPHGGELVAFGFIRP